MNEIHHNANTEENDMDRAEEAVDVREGVVKILNSNGSASKVLRYLLDVYFIQTGYKCNHCQHTSAELLYGCCENCGEFQTESFAV